MYMLEYKEFYIVKTELTKNRTHQTYRWKQLAMCDDHRPLVGIMEKNQRVVNWDNLEVVAQA